MTLSSSPDQLFDGNETFRSSASLMVSELRKPIQLISKFLRRDERNAL